MASSRYSAVFEGITTGTALKTMLQLVGAATERLTICEFTITFDGITATNVPILVELRTGVAAGSGGTSATVQKWDPSGPASTITSNTGPSGAVWTTDPTSTAGNIIAAWRVPPTSGLVMQWPLGREPWIAVSTNVAFAVTAAVAVNATGYCSWEE